MTRTIADIIADLDAAGLGHNAPPPEAALTPFDIAAAAVADVTSEARQWLDGKPVTSQEQADGLALLIDMTRKAEKLATETRKTEIAPIDKAWAEVQARYKPLLTDAERVKKALLAASTAWLAKVKAEQDAHAAALRDEAVKLAREAAIKHATADPGNLAEREAADAVIATAERASKIARQAEQAVASAKGATSTRAIGLRSYWRAEIVDPAEFARYLWRTHRAEYDAWLADMAQRIVAREKRDLPGVTAIEEQRAV